jgi:hypothetical protein
VVEIAIAKTKSMNYQVVIRIPTELTEAEVKYYGLKRMASIILFGVRKNSIGRA